MFLFTEPLLRFSHFLKIDTTIKIGLKKNGALIYLLFSNHIILICVTTDPQQPVMGTAFLGGGKKFQEHIGDMRRTTRVQIIIELSSYLI